MLFGFHSLNSSKVSMASTHLDKFLKIFKVDSKSLNQLTQLNPYDPKFVLSSVQ